MNSSTCNKCGAELHIGDFPFCPHGRATINIVDDSLEGGARMFDTMGHDEVYIASKSQWRREVARRGLIPADGQDRAHSDRVVKQWHERHLDTRREREA